MKYYTVGFVFDPGLENVLLIHKNRPDWQKGKLNGPGGKVYDNESPFVGIAREIREETGLDIPPEKWMPVAEIVERTYRCQFFGCVDEKAKEYAHTTTDEIVEWCQIDKLPTNILPSLTWLIPLCKDKIKNDDIEFVSVRYKD
ncbi:MAG: NUDIX domain-containing protein [Candidatus Diapherotrites archaeon]